MVKELKLFYEKKTESIKLAIKQLIELYKNNYRLLSGRLILLQDDHKVPIFLSFSGNI